MWDANSPGKTLNIKNYRKLIFLMTKSVLWNYFHSNFSQLSPKWEKWVFRYTAWIFLLSKRNVTICVVFIRKQFGNKLMNVEENENKIIFLNQRIASVLTLQRQGKILKCTLQKHLYLKGRFLLIETKALNLFNLETQISTYMQKSAIFIDR